MGISKRRAVRVTAAFAATMLPLSVPLSVGSPATLGRALFSTGGAETSATTVEVSAAVPVLPPQRIAPQVTLQARLVLTTAKDRNRKVQVSSTKGTRTWTASALVEHNLPAAAMRAYKNAAKTMATQDPSCQIPWTLLAGIGRVESDHGRYGGSVLGSDGVSRPAIIGVALNGKGPVAAIHDTDNGALDHDKVWDRAVGPMQFIPSTWASAGRDGDGDGVKNPNDLDDATLAAATYLCSGSGSVLAPNQMKAAIFGYNPSTYYVSLVMAFARGYGDGVFVIPSPPAPADPVKKGPSHAKRHPHHKHAVTHATKKHNAHKPAHHTASPAHSQPAPTHKPAHKPAHQPAAKPTHKPKSSPSPKPAPTPAGPTSLSGTWSACGDGWCVGSTNLDLTLAGGLSEMAKFDFDGDGTTQTNADEFAGLVGQQVQLKVVKQVVHTLGSFDLD